MTMESRKDIAAEKKASLKFNCTQNGGDYYMSSQLIKK